MSTRIDVTHVCDRCPEKPSVECEPTTVAGIEFHLCPKHLKPVLAFAELAKQVGHKQAHLNGARSPRAASVSLKGVEWVKCPACPAAKPIKVGSRYMHALKVHQAKTGEIAWQPVSQ